MKAFVVACLVVAAAAFARPAAAHSEPERAHAGITAAIAAVPLHLVRFLTNTLELPEHKVLAVENALKAHPLQTYSPEELAAVLRPVLTDEQFARLQTLKPAQLTEELRYLTSLR